MTEFASGMIHNQFDIQTSVVVRQATAQDMVQLEWHGQFKHYRRLFRRAYHEQEVGRRHLLIASMNDYPIGRLFIQYKGKRTIVADGMTRGYLYSLHVMDFMRGLGIGTHLVLTAEGILREKGYTTATIAVSKTNTGALRLYQRLDYSIFGEDEGRWQYQDHRGRVQTVEEPCYFLYKDLLA
jgi:ribosomal protein S18 acetylase RimI-like enzyme